MASGEGGAAAVRIDLRLVDRGNFVYACRAIARPVVKSDKRPHA